MNFNSKISHLSKWVGDARGVAALEFALIAPLVITMYLGLAELSLGLQADRKVSHSVSVAADMATQVTEIDAETAAELFVAALKVSEVRDPDNFTLHLESFTRNSDGEPVSLGAVWYNEGRLSDLEKIDVAALDETMLSEESGLMIARVAYEYKPLGYRRIEHQNRQKGGSSIKADESFLNRTVTLSEVIMFTPRESRFVSISSGSRDGFKCKGDGSDMKCKAADDPSGGNNTASNPDEADECLTVLVLGVCGGDEPLLNVDLGGGDDDDDDDDD